MIKINSVIIEGKRKKKGVKSCIMEKNNSRYSGATCKKEEVKIKS